MYNEYYDKLNSVDKTDYKMIERECTKIYTDYSAYDVLTFINDYIYDLSDTINNNYFLAICKLEDYYMDIYKKGIE